MNRVIRWVALVAAVAAIAVGCGSDDDSTSGDGQSASTVASPEDVLGTPKKASGEPIVLGLLNLESGPVTFPEVRLAAEAAVKYVNEYRGGVHGRPLKIESCVTDGQPATSTRCANQILDKDPLLILGGADTGAAGAFKVWERAKIAYVGGVPFTPAESNASNAAIFISLVYADNAAAVAYAKDELGVEKASIVETSDTQGKFTADVIAGAMKNAGMEVKRIPVAPDQADLSSAAASAVESSPDLVYNETPNACPAFLTALNAVGYTGNKAGIDPCTSPPALKAAGDAAEGLFFAAPFVDLDSGDKDAKLATAILAKYAPKDIALDSPALAALGSVLNLQETMEGLPESDLSSATVLSEIRSGSDKPNFLAHPYTCDRNQVPGQAAVCNGYMKIKQIKGGKVVTITEDWLDGAKYLK